MGRFVDYYMLLGVSHDAPRELILEEYRRRRRELDAETPGAGRDARLAELERAAGVLGDDMRRMAYDTYGEGGFVADDADAAAPQPRDEALVPPVPPAGAMGFAACGDRSPYSLLGVDPRASFEEVEEAYAEAVRAMKNLKSMDGMAGSEPEALGELQRDCIRAYNAVIAGKKSMWSAIWTKNTLYLGCALALIASTAWVYLIHSAAASLPAEPQTYLHVFIGAASRVSVPQLWATLLPVCIVAWYQFLLTRCVSWLLMSELTHSELLGSDRMSAVAALVPAAAIWTIFMRFTATAQVVSLAKSPLDFDVAIVNYAKLFITMCIVITGAIVSGKAVAEAAVFQASIVFGHFLIVAWTAHLAVGSVGAVDYFLLGLVSFGFWFWWLALCAFGAAFERLRRRGFAVRRT